MEQAPWMVASEGGRVAVKITDSLPLAGLDPAIQGATLGNVRRK